MRKIFYNLDIGYPGCGDEGILAVPDNMPDHEIDTMVSAMADEYAGSWEGDERLGWDSDMSEEEQEEYTDSFREGISHTWRDATDDDE